MNVYINLTSPALYWPFTTKRKQYYIIKWHCYLKWVIRIIYCCKVLCTYEFTYSHQKSSDFLFQYLKNDCLNNIIKINILLMVKAEIKTYTGNSEINNKYSKWIENDHIGYYILKLVLWWDVRHYSRRNFSGWIEQHQGQWYCMYIE